MKSGYTLLLLVPLVALSVSCAEKEPQGEGEALGNAVYGFYLGETKQDLFGRAIGKVSWRELEGNRWDYRGELYRFDAPLDGTEGIYYLRLGFLDNRLMEVIAYYSDTSRWKLSKLKKELEERYGGTMVAPDGTVEMAYKTYRLSGPGRSITLRRITKHTGIELYVQYLHDELHARLVQRKLETQSE
jgi:hypothetical protein